MTHKQLDQMLRQRAQRECRLSAAAYDEAFSRAMAQGKALAQAAAVQAPAVATGGSQATGSPFAVKGRPAAGASDLNAAKAPFKARPAGLRWLAVATACTAAVIIAVNLLWQPPKDKRSGYLLTAEIPTAFLPLSEPSSPAAPQVSVTSRFTANAVMLKAAWRNQTKDIWLVTWQALLSGTEAPLQAPTPLIWLEPGTECEDEALYPSDAPTAAPVRYAYQGYRVSAEVLFWIDELIPPEGEDYAEQQALFEDAFAANALLIAPQAWANGEAGGMTLVLPQSYAEAHPEQSPLDYYLENGLLNAVKGFGEAAAE